ncbi:glycine--tRNA ligase subunit alpha [candidate division TA06 bacterium]|uniref:Glycine--tRNA ligase alpha subunit n=1 Tax=candidate division TA06 bacterium TaxID=2250710 RepID=A0A523XI04_UNCT6|nr:MAG: glycine--tRNA ligase subunit alpha [candidate division TA06 bacterium]
MTLQDMIRTLDHYWGKKGCLIWQPYSSEVGAGTFNPATFLRVLGPDPWKVAYVEQGKRPRDGRYAVNPNRVYQHHQYQVILKPSPFDIQDVYLNSLKSLGIKLLDHDIRFLEDDWDAPTLGAWGIGWQVWLDGIEITQFTYFQQVGGLDLEVIPVELTYGIERIACIIQNKPSIFDLQWTDTVTWGDLFRNNEIQYSRLNYEEADVELYFLLFDKFEDEAKRLIDEGMYLPGYDYVIKCSHAFNILEARGAISVTERASYIARVRRLARRTALAYVKAKTEG